MRKPQPAWRRLRGGATQRRPPCRSAGILQNDAERTNRHDAHARARQTTQHARDTPLHVVGGGLAGCEAAWQLAERGHTVHLHEMRPVRATAAHKTDRLAELVCSNTFKSTEITNAHGLLKAEMRALGSMVLTCA